MTTTELDYLSLSPQHRAILREMAGFSTVREGAQKLAATRGVSVDEIAVMHRAADASLRAEVDARRTRERAETAEFLAAVRALPAKHREAVETRYGLNGRAMKPARQVAHERGFTVDVVRAELRAAEDMLLDAISGTKA